MEIPIKHTFGNYYLEFYSMGLKPFDTLASLEQIYADYESKSYDWLNSISCQDFIEGQKLLKRAIDYIKKVRDKTNISNTNNISNNINGGNAMNTNTNETKKVTIEIEVPVYEDRFDSSLAIINLNNTQTEITKKRIEISNRSVVKQVIGYIDAIIRPLLDKQPTIIFGNGYYGSKSRAYKLERNDTTLETIQTFIRYESYYKSIVVSFHGSYGDRKVDFWVTPDKGTIFKPNEYVAASDAAVFIARYWSTLKIQINEAIEDGEKKAIEKSSNALTQNQNTLQLLENFTL